jgi:putative peptidoglycan lipid II flippase
LLFYALGLVAHALVEIVTRAFYALHDTLTPVVVGGGAMALNVVFSLILINYIGDPGTLAMGPFGGLALANTLATTLEGFGLLWLIRRRLDGLAGGRLLGGLWRAGLASLGMGLALAGMLSLLGGSSVWLIAIFGVVVGGVVFLGLAWLLGSEEARLFTRFTLSRLRGKKS